MRIWVDADACPVVIREILIRAAGRARVPVTFVANAYIQIPRSPYVEFRKVPAGFDVADETISEELAEGDLVVTADIPLASKVIDRHGHALNPRGEMYSPETIRSLLNMRDFMETLRSSGISTGGPPPISQSDRKKFADSLDRFLAKHRRRD